MTDNKKERLNPSAIVKRVREEKLLMEKEAAKEIPRLLGEPFLQKIKNRAEGGYLSARFIFGDSHPELENISSGVVSDAVEEFLEEHTEGVKLEDIWKQKQAYTSMFAGWYITLFGVENIHSVVFMQKEAWVFVSLHNWQPFAADAVAVSNLHQKSCCCYYWKCLIRLEVRSTRT